MRAVSAAPAGKLPSGFAGQRFPGPVKRRVFPSLAYMSTGEISSGVLRPKPPKFRYHVQKPPEYVKSSARNSM